jgi:hypothetical protein
MESIILQQVLPAVSKELEHLLEKAGESALAVTVPELLIVERCRCGDDFCASFYTQPKPPNSYPAGHRTLALAPTEGMIIVDVVADKIAFVEILYRDAIRNSLLALLP